MPGEEAERRRRSSATRDDRPFRSDPAATHRRDDDAEPIPKKSGHPERAASPAVTVPQPDRGEGDVAASSHARVAWITLPGQMLTSRPAASGGAAKVSGITSREPGGCTFGSTIDSG